MAMKSDKPAMNWQAQDLHKEWRRFKQHCEFCFKGPLAGKSEIEKVNYLMTYIGANGRDIYQTFQWQPARTGTNGEAVPAENETLEGVYNKYETYVKPKKNEIRATVNFHRRKQMEGEKFDSFVTDLKLLIKDCNYQEEERMLRDAIVVKALSQIVREKCLNEGDTLTLAKAIQIGQNFEVAQDSIKVINKESEVHAMHQRRKDHKKSKGYQRPIEGQNLKGKEKRKCSKCGYNYDRNHKCPAEGKTCAKCGKRNHFAAVCRSPKPAHAVEETTLEVQNEGSPLAGGNYSSSDESDDFAYPIYTVNEVEKKPPDMDEWYENVNIDRHAQPEGAN